MHMLHYMQQPKTGLLLKGSLTVACIGPVPSPKGPQGLCKPTLQGALNVSARPESCYIKASADPKHGGGDARDREGLTPWTWLR